MTTPLSEFVKFYPLRAKGLVWLFGAGSSVSAGVPTAYDLTWDFKRRIYCAEQSYPLHLYNNLTDSGIRNQIQNYFDSQGICPKEDSPDEYSYYFERVFKSARDRSEYISNITNGLQLSYGHNAIGILMKNQMLNMIFTTNFDKAFENIASNQFGRLENWLSADLDSGERGMKFFQSGKRPLIVKLHGDYFSDNLKNTSEELQSQDKRLRDILSISLNTNGICVMGYSGRDKSVMDILKESASKLSSFPNGIFWFIRSGSKPLPEVLEFIDFARAHGKQAEIVEIETFDTAWADIIKGFDNLPLTDLTKLNESYLRLKNIPLPFPGTKYPLIRLNALLLTAYPATARIYACDAGNTKEVLELVAKSKLPLQVIRKNAGIVGFGVDDDFRKTFEGYGEYDLGLFQITSKDLLYDNSTTKGLLTTALLQALTNGRPLRWTKRRDKYFIFPDPKKLDHLAFKPIKKQLDNISGNVPNTRLVWVISLEISLQYVLSTPLVQISPSVVVSKSSEKNEKAVVAPYVKELTAKWYNQKFDALLSAWIEVLFENNKEITVSAFDSGMAGINATFKIKRTTAFTRTT